MNLLCKLLRQDPNSRSGQINATSILGILVNILLSVIKIIIGTLTSSIAIVSEGVNGAADVLSALLTLIGNKLANKHPDAKHPFGYGRIEYLVSLIISVLIIITGVEMMKSAINLIFHPEELQVSYVAMIIIIISAIMKYTLGTFTINVGKKIDSNALIGVGADSKSDSYASIITIVSICVYIIFNISLDAYAGIIISLLIIKAGYEILMETIDDLLGKPGKNELAEELYHEIRSTDGILLAADMMLHNYGPDQWSGSVNVEIDHNKTVGEIYEFLHELQLKIMNEYHVVMVFGVYAVNQDHPMIQQLRKDIIKYVKDHEFIKSYHALYLNSKTNNIYCDFIVDYQLKDWELSQKEATDYLSQLYPDYTINIIIETEYV